MVAFNMGGCKEVSLQRVACATVETSREREEDRREKKKRNEEVVKAVCMCWKQWYTVKARLGKRERKRLMIGGHIYSSHRIRPVFNILFCVEVAY